MRILLLTGLFAVCAAAQIPSEPPALIQLIRQPGLEAGLPRPYSDIGAHLTVLAMTAITGVPESWLLETHDSFASIENLDQALAPAIRNQLDAMDNQSRFEKEVVAPPRTMIALYRPNWSYRANEAVKLLPKARYFYVTIYTIRSGTEAAFAEAVHRRRAGFETVNLDRPELAYPVLSGAPSGTILFLAPLTSLKTMDEALTKSPELPTKVAAEGEINREHFLLRVEPRLSFVSDDFAETDPLFWRGIAKQE